MSNRERLGDRKEVGVSSGSEGGVKEVQRQTYESTGDERFRKGRRGGKIGRKRKRKKKKRRNVSGLMVYG